MSIDVSTLAVEVRSTGIKETSTELNKLFVEAGKADRRVTTLTASVEKLSQAFTKGSASAIAYQQAVANANRQVGGHNATTTALTQAMATLASAVGKLTTSFNAVTPAIQNQTRAIRTHTDAMKDAHAMARGLAGSLGALWVTYGRAVPMALGIAVGASFAAIVKQGKDVENTLEGIRVKGEESYASIDALRATVMELGKGMYGPQEVAKALETLILAGLNAKQAMAGVRDALNLATVGGTSIEKAAGTLVQVSTSLGYTAEGFGRVGDVIAKTAAVSMSSVESLSEAFKSASAVGKLYGASLVDIGTGLAALSQLGIQGSAAGTSLKNFYKELASNADKVQNVFKSIGLSQKDLKDANGNFLDMVTVVGKLSDGLNQLSPANQKLAMDALANERGLKTLVEVLDMYRKKTDDAGNALKDFRDRIADSYAFTALGAAQMSLTVENQFKSVKNTLSTSFVAAFDGIQPQLLVFSARLKEIFQSDTFKTAIQSIATSLADLAVVLADNIGKLTAIVTAILAFKSAMFVIETIKSISTAFVALNEAMIAARLGAIAFQASLGVIGIVLLAAGAAWAYYNTQKDDQNDTKQRAALTTLDEYAKSLTKEAERMAEVNRLMLEGKTAREASATATEREALALAEKNKQAAIEAAQAKVKEAQKNYDDAAPGRFSINGEQSYSRVRAKVELDAAMRNLQQATATADQQMAAVEIAISRNRSEARTQAAIQAAQAEAARAKALADAKDGQLAVKGSKTVQNTIASEIASLHESAAAYKAKTDALVQSEAIGSRVVADSNAARMQALLLEPKYAHAISESTKQQLLNAAAEADANKFAYDKEVALRELTESLQKKMAVETASLAEANAGHSKFTSVVEAETAALLKQWGVEEGSDRYNRLMAIAKAIGEVTVAQERAAKFNKATDNLMTEARSLVEAGDAVADYGRKGKQTALQLAQLQIAQNELDPSTQATIISARLAAAALHDLGSSYKELGKIGSDLYNSNEKQLADDVASVLTSETEKVEARRQATLKTIDFYSQQADAAFQAAVLEGNVTQEVQEAFEKAMTARANALSELDKQTEGGMSRGLVKDMETLTQQSQTLGQTLTDTFGSAGTAIGGMVTAMSGLVQAQTQYADSLRIVNELRAKGDNAKALKVEQQAQSDLAQSQMKSYANMAGAAKSFFKEGTTGYKVLSALEKTYRTMEMALAYESMIRKIFFTQAVTSATVAGNEEMTASTVLSTDVEVQAAFAKSMANAGVAVTNQGGGDPYTAFARIAAMAAIMAALGFAVGGSGASVDVAKERQAVQGTGTVLGDESAKSESLSKALDILSNNSSIELTHSSQMLVQLRGINNGIAGMAATVSSTAGLRGTSADLMKIGVGSSKSFLGFSKSSTELQDSGISFDRIALSTPQPLTDADGNPMFQARGGSLVAPTRAQTLGDVLSGGINAQGYADIHKESSSFFGLFSDSSNESQMSALDPALKEGMARTLVSMFNSVLEAGTQFGVNRDVAENLLKALNLDELGLTKISLKGLSGADVQKELEAAFSKAGDVMAEAVMPGLKEFQKVGEGYFETIVRVSSGVEKGQYVLEQLGIQAVAYSDIQNKQGDVSAELVRDSIVAAEGFNSNIGDIVETLQGSADDIAGVYKQLTTLRNQFNQTGLNGSNLSVDTIRGAGGLDALSTGMSDFVDNFFTDAEKNSMLKQTLTDQFHALGLELPKTKEEFKALVISLDDGTAAGDALVGKLLTLSGTFSDLTDTTKTLADTAKETADKTLSAALDGLKRSVDAEKKRLTGIYNAQVEAIKKQADLATKAEQAKLKPAQQVLKDAQSIFDAIQSAIKSTVVETQALDIARRKEAQNLLAGAVKAGNLSDVAGFKDALTNVSKPSEGFFSTLEDYQRDQARTSMLLASLSGKSKGEVDKAQLTIDAINDTIDAIKQTSEDQLKALADSHQADLDRLDAIVDAAQSQIDALNGIDTSVKSISTALANFQTALSAAFVAHGLPAVGATGSTTSAGGGAGGSGITTNNFGNGAISKISSPGTFAPGFDSSGGYAVGDGSTYVNAERVAQIGSSLNNEVAYTNAFLAQYGKLPDLVKGAATSLTVEQWAAMSPDDIQTMVNQTAGEAMGATFTQDQVATITGLVPKFAVGTNDVPEDMLAQIHTGERIIPAADNVELMRRLKSPDESAQAQKDLKDAIEDLKSIIKDGDLANVQKTKDLYKIFQRWDSDGMPVTRTE